MWRALVLAEAVGAKDACTYSVGDADLTAGSVSAWCIASSTDVDDRTDGAFPGADILRFSCTPGIDASFPVPIESSGIPTCPVGSVKHMPWIPDFSGFGAVSTDYTD